VSPADESLDIRPDSENPLFSGVCAQRRKYSPRHQITRFVGLSGIYDVKRLVPHLDRRGLYKHVMYQMAGGKRNLGVYSVPSYFDRSRRGEIGDGVAGCDHLLTCMPKQLILIHGTADKSAPLSETTSLASILRTFATTTGNGTDTNRDVHTILVTDATHTDPFIDELLVRGSSCVVDIIEEYVRPSAVSQEPRKSIASTQQLTVTPGDRSRLLRAARWVCPF